MTALLLSTLALAAVLWVALRVLEGSTRMASYRPARAWQEGRRRALLPAHLSALVDLPVEPRNAWSNLGYFVAGWIPAVLEAPDAPNLAGLAPELLFGAAMTYLAVASFLFHATLTTWAQNGDHSAMLTIFPLLAVFAAAAETSWVPGLMIVAGLGGAILGRKWFPTRFEKHGSNSMNGAILVFLVLTALPAFARGSWRMAVASIALFGAGALLSLWLDKRDHPLLGLWKHAAWHTVFTAPALTLMFLAQGGPS